MPNKIRTLISCFNDGTAQSPTPVGFDWANTLATTFKGKYKQTILLHGDCLKYGLVDSAYQPSFGGPNPFSVLLKQLYDYGVKIVICNLCLTNDGFTKSQLLSFVEPIAFSVDYIATHAKKGVVVIYDAKLSQ